MIWWTLKGSIILMLAFAATAVLRRRPAAVRHAIWTVAIVAQLLVSLVPALAPRRTLAVPVRIEAMVPAIAPTAPTAPPTSPANQPAHRHLDPKLLFAAGGALLLLRLLVGTFKVVALARRSSRVTDGEWLSLHTRLCDALRISRPVTLRHAHGLQIPVTWGFLYPVVLLPAASRGWPEELRRHVLLHELAHVRRADALTQLLGQATLVLYWFNPLLWLAIRRMRAEAENACDDYVLRDGERPSRYAATLVELVRAHSGPTPPAFATLSVGQRSDLELRVGAITSPRRDPSARRALLATVVVTAVAIVLPLSALYPKEQRVVSKTTCRPLLVDDYPFHESSGTLTANGRTTHYFFLHPEPGRCLEASFNLDARFTDDDRDLAPTGGLRALIHEARGGDDRAVYIDEAAGRLTYRYLEDGRAAEWDRSAQRWYEEVLPDVIARTYAGAEARTARIVEREGVDGLFAELSRIALPDVQVRYLTALLSLRSPAELPRSTLIARVRDELAIPAQSFSNLLAEIVAREGGNDGVREAVLDAAQRLDKGPDRITVLQAMGRHPDPRVREAAAAIEP